MRGPYSAVLCCAADAGGHRTGTHCTLRVHWGALARSPLEGTASLEDQIRIAQVFATDTILTTLMCATRSVYSWDIIITRTADALYLDKRDPEVRPWP